MVELRLELKMKKDAGKAALIVTSGRKVCSR